MRAYKACALLAGLLWCWPGEVMAQGIQYHQPSLANGGATNATLGAELAPAITAANWTCGAGWDCSVAGTLNKNADGVGTAAPTAAIVAVVGTTYRVSITVGALTVASGATYTLGGMQGSPMTAAGTFVDYITATTTASLIITPTPTATRFTITAVSVKALTDATGDLEVQGNLWVRSPGNFFGSIFVNRFCDPLTTCATGYERGYLTINAAGEFELGSTGAGTGVSTRGMYLNPGSGSIYTENLAGYASNTYFVGTSAASYAGATFARTVQGATAKSLTDAAAATPFVTIAVPTNGWVGGEIIWTATSVSGADQLVAQGRHRWWGVTTAGTPVCGINKIGTDGEGHSGGANTLVCTWTNVVAAQTCALSVTCTNDLAAAQAITLYGRIDMPIALATASVVFP